VLQSKEQRGQYFLCVRTAAPFHGNGNDDDSTTCTGITFRIGDRHRPHSAQLERWQFKYGTA
jgi:hypothetical protein